LKKAKFITLFIFFSSQHDPHLSQQNRNDPNDHFCFFKS
jgi:hypothetical protein